MKFYIDKENNDYWNKTKYNKLNMIYCYFISINYCFVEFYKNGSLYNHKNAAFVKADGYKSFCLNGKYYGNENDFTKKSWRKFTKMQVFL
jgi:hypothetical protein